jgi:hypothetical protein
MLRPPGLDLTQLNGRNKIKTEKRKLLNFKIYLESFIQILFKQTVNFQDIFTHSLADVLFKSSSKSSPMLYILSMYKVGPVPKNTQKRVVTKACQFYFDSCRCFIFLAHSNKSACSTGS